MLNDSAIHFLEDLSSSKPAPGGGGAASYTSAIGTALGMMVINLTKGKKKFLIYDEDHQRLLKSLQQSLDTLVELVQADADNFVPLSQAYGLPNGTDEEKAHKAKVMEECLHLACQAPMDIMEESVKVMAFMEELLEKGSKLVMSDVGVGIALLYSGVQGASLNVMINAKMMKDSAHAKKVNDRADYLIETAESYYQEIFTKVKEIIA